MLYPAVVILCLFSAACIVTWMWGVGTAFAGVLLPTILLLFNVLPIPLPGIPDMSAPVGVVYGIALGWTLRGGEALRIRLHLIDVIVVLMGVSAVITATLNGNFWSGVSTGGGLCLTWTAPYLLARCALRSASAREVALRAVVICMVIVAFFALIEARLWPYFLGRHLQSLNLYTAAIGATYRRYGLFRAQVSFCHPIDLGNACLLVVPLLLMLGHTTVGGANSGRVRLGIICALVGVVLSISFTSYFGLATVIGLYLVLRSSRLAAHLLVPGVVAGAAAAVLIGALLLQRPLHMDSSRTDEAHSTFDSSLDIRALIVQRAWPMAKEAGAWGGKINMEALGLESVDNAYLLFALSRGWVFVALWVLLALVLARSAELAFGNAVLPRQRSALAAGAAAVLGTMVAMYTVWFGFVYASVFFMALGFVVTIIEDLASTGMSAVAPPPAAMQRPTAQGVATVAAAGRGV